jgi:uncharacterized membrane protein
VKLTRSLSACDDGFVGLNLLKLLSVSLLPFTTSLMANHLTAFGQRPAAVLFGLNMTFASVMSLVLSSYASRTESIVREGERPELRRLLREQWPYAVMFGLATVVGAFLPTVAVILYLAFAALMFFRPCGTTDQTLAISGTLSGTGKSVVGNSGPARRPRPSDLAA